MSDGVPDPDERVSRFAHCLALEGRGEELADLLLEVAAVLETVSGCELYVVNRVPLEPDTVWVTEIWSSRDEMHASLRLPAIAELIPQVQQLVAEWDTPIDVVPVGGVGLRIDA